MLAIPTIRLALPSDTRAIAEMSRDYIEQGLGWSWTRERVLHALRDLSTNVAVTHRGDRLCGFGIMHYGDDSAHLALLALHPGARHQRLGAQLLDWLERPAVIAGVRQFRVEARADNHSAITFYQCCGYSVTGRVEGYYDGLVDAVQLQKSLAGAEH